MLKFFDWAFKNGDQLAADLDYVPLRRQGRRGHGPRHWAKDIKDKSGQPRQMS